MFPCKLFGNTFPRSTDLLRKLVKTVIIGRAKSWIPFQDPIFIL